MHYAFVYVLHFDRPLSHAEHYVGCTHAIRARLTAHANGAGSQLCRALIQEGINWRLGGLYTCSHTEMRRIERGIKDTHNSPRFCSICSELPARFPGCTPYPIDSLPDEMDCLSLRKPSKPSNVNVRLTYPNEPADTYRLIFHIQQAEKDALGFIPVCGEGGLQRLGGMGQIAIVSNNDEDVGYAAYTLSHDRSRLTIHQCCVRDDARLLQHGRSLVTLILGTNPYAECVAKVRDDLAANHFWQAIGFQFRRQILHRTSKNKINIYYHIPILTLGQNFDTLSESS